MPPTRQAERHGHALIAKLDATMQQLDARADVEGAEPGKVSADRPRRLAARVPAL
ncbi:hypothetical protein [Nonomuraea rubra]|uniref:hypothetical protein n=1 Tax=Nonomuraea rubra TaxID=46180 RepID=UPI0033DF5542